MGLESTAQTRMPPAPLSQAPGSRWRPVADHAAAAVLRISAVAVCLGAVALALFLIVRSLPLVREHSLSTLLGSVNWFPLRNEFGFRAFIAGSLWVTGLAVALAVPLALLSAVYLAEYAPPRLRATVRVAIDLLAGIPSIIFGVWGVVAIVPLISRFAQAHGAVSTSGYSVLAGGIVLAMMILPYIIHVSVEVIEAVAGELREASLAVGATHWQTVKHVVVRTALPGLTAAVVLGVSRAFGETMAVLMVSGNMARVPRSLLDPAYPLPALIANNFGEMLSIPLYDSALLFSALLLLAVVIFFNLATRVLLACVRPGGC